MKSVQRGLLVKCELYLVVVLWVAARGLCGEGHIKDL